MMNISDVARKLGTTPDRVVRSARRLGMQFNRAGLGERAPRIVSAAQYSKLKAVLGSAPARQAGFTRAQLKILAALARAPRGLVSARAVARRAGVAPATATHSLERLASLGLIEQRVERIALGNVHTVSVWHAVPHAAAWPRTAELLHTIELPQLRQPKPRRVPNELRHLFWNTDASQLDLLTSGPYIARRLISAGDLDGLAWGLEHLDRKAWMHAAATRGLTPRQRATAENLAAAAR